MFNVVPRASVHSKSPRCFTQTSSGARYPLTDTARQRSTCGIRIYPPSAQSAQSAQSETSTCTLHYDTDITRIRSILKINLETSPYYPASLFLQIGQFRICSTSIGTRSSLRPLGNLSILRLHRLGRLDPLLCLESLLRLGLIVSLTGWIAFTLAPRLPPRPSTASPSSSSSSSSASSSSASSATLSISSSSSSSSSSDSSLVSPDLDFRARFLGALGALGFFFTGEVPGSMRR